FWLAFNSKVSPVSGISTVQPISSKLFRIIWSSSNAFTSSNLCLLLVAKTISFIFIGSSVLLHPRTSVSFLYLVASLQSYSCIETGYYFLFLIYSLRRPLILIAEDQHLERCNFPVVIFL